MSDGEGTKFQVHACAQPRLAGRRQAKFEAKILNPKLKTLNSKQTQMFKPQNSKPKELAVEFYILDLFGI